MRQVCRKLLFLILTGTPLFTYATTVIGVLPSNTKCQDLLLDRKQQYRDQLSRKQFERPPSSRANFTDSLGISLLVHSKKTILVAHGKNHNTAPESTWRNIKNSFKVAAKMPIVLEMDLQLTKDNKYIITHDPTFHRLAKNYHTSQEKINNFWLEARRNESLYAHALEAEKKGPYVFNLFDGARNYTLAEIKDTFRVYDPETQIEADIITLAEILESLSQVNQENQTKPINQIVFPKYLEKVNESFTTIESETYFLKHTIAIYFDLKAINNLARRYNNQNDWNWIINSLSLAELESYTKNAINEYSSLLNKYNAYNSTITAVRHPKVLKMLRELDSKINVMISSELINKNSSAQDFIQIFAEYLSDHSLTDNTILVEIKYLPHILNIDIRTWADKNNLRLFYNEIKETDPEQFEGIYKDNLSKLLDDIFTPGKNIWIQTNTVNAVADYLLRN